MLTSEQIESLFTFCRKHFVYYYDVQVELVDHLANAVEAEMKAVPEITFEKALEKVHAGFGIFGFAPLVAEKEKMAIKKERRLFWNICKEQFRWPKILLFFLLTILMFTLFSTDLISMKWSIITIIFLAGFCNLYQTLKVSRTISKSGKKFLLSGMAQFTGLSWMPFYLLYYPRMFEKNFFINIHSPLSILFLSLCLSLLIILVIALWQTISSVRDTLYKNYPEVFSIEK